MKQNGESCGAKTRLSEAAEGAAIGGETLPFHSSTVSKKLFT
jgi:hypothetical protein